MIRSVLSVMAGYAVVVVLTMVTFAVMFREQVGLPAEEMEPPTVPQMWFLLAAGFVYGIIGGYVTATVAARDEVMHAIMLGIVSTLLGIINMVMFWGQEPIWFQLVLIAIPIPSAYIGGSLRARQKGQSEAPA